MRVAAHLPAIRVVHSDTLRDRLNVHLQLLCANLGCDAIEARVLFAAGKQSIVAHGEAAAADGDLQRLKRIPRQRRKGI
jgi:hypothetical protein